MQQVDDILQVLQDWAANKVPVDPAAWLEASLKLVALVGEESDKLFTIESALSQCRAKFMEEGDTAAKAKVKVEAMPEYLAARRLKAKIERVYEIIKLAKLRSRLGQEEYKGN